VPLNHSLNLNPRPAGPGHGNCRNPRRKSGSGVGVITMVRSHPRLFSSSVYRGESETRGRRVAIVSDYLAEKQQLAYLLGNDAVNIQGGPKNRTVFRLDNSVTVSPRKACSMSKFSQFYREKRYKTHILVSLNILCQICSNRNNS